MRMNLLVSVELAEWLQRAEDESGVTRGRILATGIALLRICQTAIREGKHVGLVSDAGRLDTEIVGLY